MDIRLQKMHSLFLIKLKRMDFMDLFSNDILIILHIFHAVFMQMAENRLP